MIQENEALMLLLAVGVLTFIWTSRRRLQHFPAPRTLFAAFYVLVLAWILTILEGLFWQEALNFAEHVCYAGNAVLMAAWFWQAFGEEREKP